MADGTDETGSLDMPSGEPDATETEAAAGSRWARLTRDRRVVIGAAALALLLLLGGLALAFAGDDGDEDDDDARRASSDGPTVTLEPKPGDRDGDGVPDEDDEDPDDARVGRRAGASTTDPDNPDDPDGPDSTGGPGGTNTATSFPSPTGPGGTQPPFPEDPEADVVSAYLGTWEQTCNAVWARSPNGILVDPYLPDAEFTVEECTLYADAEGAIGFFTIEDAVIAAQTEAWDVASDLGTYGVLCVRNTNNCWEWGDE